VPLFDPDQAGMDMELFTHGMLAYQQAIEATLRDRGDVHNRSWRLERPALKMLFMLLTINGDNYGKNAKLSRAG